MIHFYKLSPEESLSQLKTQLKSGLNEDEALSRISEYGYNNINIEKKESLIKLLLTQFSNPIVIILMFAVVLSILTGKTFEGSLIGSIVVFMAIVGVYLENRANSAVDKLKSLTVPMASVIRNGKERKIDAENIVPGDILFLVDGDKIPADARIVEQNYLHIDEAVLTGESIPVAKNAEVITETAIIGDQKNMLFAGTFITQGNVKAVVVETGLNTQLGQIAEKLSQADDKKTPLQEQLESLSKFLFVGTILICTLIMVLTVIRKEPIIEGLIQSLSLAIAFIPEGLTAVMTVVLALGVREMVKKKAIIKRLLAAEGLGSISVLATDKTGTITTGKMSVEKIWVYKKEIEPYDFKSDNPHEKDIINIIRFCNNAKGATEEALVNFLNKNSVTFELEDRVKEHRFSSDLKRMSVVKKINEKYNSYSKGAPDVLIPMCAKYSDYESNKIFDLDEKKLNEILSTAENLAAQGYRVLCLAYRELDEKVNIDARHEVENELIFVGLVGLIDPLREEVASTVAKLKLAGIRPVMITGDHPEIARTISVEADINESREKAKVITGKMLDEYFEQKGELTEKDILECSVFARVTPDHKNRLIDLYEKNNIQAAMAGDGINDAVAVNRAKIGIAVANATDIVKEAADVVITGSYDALANAVEIGRLVMFRTRLYLHYLLSGNLCQVGVFILALIFNLPFPLTAVSLLVINLLTDATPAMAMAFEKGNKNIMREKPKPVGEGIINSEIYKSILIQGLASSAFLFAVFYLTLDMGEVFAQTATFTAYIFQKLFRAFTARSFKESILSYGALSNRFLLGSIVLGLSVWAIIVYVVPETFEMQSLPIKTIIPIMLASILMPILEEILKLLKRMNLKILM